MNLRENETLLDYLMHEPYRISDEYRGEISTRQRIKGAIKYPELFNPDSHSDEELADHAMMEFHDGQEYVSGMRTRMQQLRQTIERKDAKINELRLLLSAYMKGDNSPKVDGSTSDGYHTFDELYYHRMMLFSVICNQNKSRAWKSKLHHDGTMYDDYFIVGIETDEGSYTYHHHIDHWDQFNVTEKERAPEYDGHKPEDITRLLTIIDGSF